MYYCGNCISLIKLGYIPISRGTILDSIGIYIAGLDVGDLCKFIDILLEKRPSQHIFNVGNSDAISIRQWIELCYRVVGKEVEFKNVYANIDQRKYFSFYNYEYYLDVSKQHELMPNEKDLYEGIKESFMWYKDNAEKVNKKTYFEFIDTSLLDCYIEVLLLVCTAFALPSHEQILSARGSNFMP